MGLIKILTSLSFAIIFAIAIITFAVNFANDNTVYVDISDNPDISSLNTQLGSEVSNFKTTANSSSLVLQKSNIESGDENTEGGSQFKPLPNDLVGGIKSLSSTSKKVIFGNNNEFGVVFTILISLLVTIAGLYVWKTWKGGNPD